MMLKIASWNVNSLRVRLSHVLDWLNIHKPDMLALQEIKLENKDFPLDAFTSIGYHAVYAGQKTYNGVAILSRTPAENINTDMPQWSDPQRRILAATINNIRLINLYIPNGSDLDSPKYLYKLEWLKEMTAYLQQELAQHEHVVIVGDFNIAPEDRDVHDPAAWAGQVLVSEPERQVLRNWLTMGLQDSFRLFEQEPNSFSWWDYRAAAFRRNMGLRIDHIWISPALAKLCKISAIDKTPRKLDRPSDHVPVWAEFNI
jgi:exodeoxyribonuclease III